MTQSNVSYQFRKVQGYEFLMIIDEGGPYMSVTNNIENVVQQICIIENISPFDVKIIYQDSTGQWDGFDWKTQEFIPISEKHWLKAATKLI